MNSICIAHGEELNTSRGGTVRAVELSKGLSNSGYQVHVVAPAPGDKDKAPKNVSGVEFHLIDVDSKPSSFTNQLIRAIRVLRKANKIKNKTNSLLQIERSNLAGLYSIIYGGEYICDMHDLEFSGPNYDKTKYYSVPIKILESIGVRNSSGIFVVSEKMQEYIINEWGISEELVHVIPNGTRGVVSKFNKNLEISKTNGIGFIGVVNSNIDYGKFELLANTYSEEKIHIIGSGPMKEIVSELSDSYDNVNYYGYLPDEEAYRILNNCRVCIFPMRDNLHTKMAMHMKCWDYAALAKPIVTDRDATGRILEESNAALVSDPGISKEFINNVGKALEDDTLCKRISTNANELYEDYRWESIHRKISNVYNSHIEQNL